MKRKIRFLLNIVLFATITVGFLRIQVYADADKTALIAAKAQIESIMATQDSSPEGDSFYEDASYTAFIDAITALGGTAGIQAVIDDPLALQIHVDNMVADINVAIAGLVTSDTFYATLANFSNAKDIDLDPYTSDSQILYNLELDRIEAILYDPTAGDQTVDDLNIDIDNAASLLVLRGDKTDLLAKKGEIDMLYAGDGADYTPSSFAEFQNAYEDIDNVLMDDIGMTLTQLIDDIDALPDEVSAAEVRLDEILTILVLRPDKSDLIEEYNNALDLDETIYTSDSYADFTSELVFIQAVINNPEALETDVEQALVDLAGLYALLVEKADLSQLALDLDAALSLDLSEYTPESVSEYLDALAIINSIVEADDSDEDQATQAATDLLAAGNLLVLQADRSTLSTLNEMVIVAYYEERLLYTMSSYSAFKEAVDTYGSYLYVNSIISDDNIDQDTVDALVLALENALDLLKPLIDNTELLNVYLSYKSADLATYTQDSQTLYNDELDRIYAILIGRELDADAAAQIILDFLAINDLLVDLPDFTALQDLYDLSNIYREENYSISSYGAFMTAKSNALEVINDPNANTSMVESAMQNLENAIANLVIKAEKIYIFEDQTIDINTYVTLGEATVVSYSTIDNAIISVDGTGIVTGIKFGESQVLIELSNGYTEVLDIHVKAKVNTTVYILTFTIPVASVGLGAVIIYIKKDTWTNAWQIISKIFKRKR